MVRSTCAVAVALTVVLAACATAAPPETAEPLYVDSLACREVHVAAATTGAYLDDYLAGYSEGELDTDLGGRQEEIVATVDDVPAAMMQSIELVHLEVPLEDGTLSVMRALGNDDREDLLAWYEEQLTPLQVDDAQVADELATHLAEVEPRLASMSKRCNEIGHTWDDVGHLD